MEGISKAAPTTTEPVIITHPDPAQIHNKDPEVAIDIYRFFGVSMDNLDASVTKKLKEISDWTFQDVETLGDGLTKLKNLEIKLGYPRPDEQRYDKLYNWILIQRDITELQKKQRALS